MTHRCIFAIYIVLVQLNVTVINPKWVMKQMATVLEGNGKERKALSLYTKRKRVVENPINPRMSSYKTGVFQNKELRRLWNCPLRRQGCSLLRSVCVKRCVRGSARYSGTSRQMLRWPRETLSRKTSSRARRPLLETKKLAHSLKNSDLLGVPLRNINGRCQEKVGSWRHLYSRSAVIW